MADKFMVADALKAGMTPQQISMYVRQNGLTADTTGVSSWQAKQVGRDIPHVPEVPRTVTVDNGPGLTQQQTNRSFGNIITHEVGPTVASLALAALVPETGLLKVPAMLARPAAAYLGGFGGEGAAQSLNGEPLSPSAMNERGAREGVGQFLGEALTGWMPGKAHEMYRDAMRPTKATTTASMRTQTRLAGKSVTPQAADLAAQGLRERMPIGSAFGSGTSAEHLADLRSAPNDAISGSLAAADASSHRTTINDLLRSLGDLRQQVMKEQGGLTNLEQIDKWSQELRRQFLEPAAVPGQARRTKRWTASELDAETRVWQKQAKDAYTGKADPNVALRARFDAALARAGRKRLEAIPVPSPFNPASTVGDDIAQANLRLSELKPLEAAAQDAEIGIVTGANRGRLLPHWSKAGFEPPRLKPAWASRVALTMDNPAFRQGVRRAPNIGMAGASALDALMNPQPVPFQPARRDK